MKSFKFLAAFALLPALFSCQTEEPAFEQTEEVGPYTVSLIEKDVWHVEDCNSSNPEGLNVKEDSTYTFNNCSDMYIIRGTDKAILIDLSNKIEWADSADVALQKIFNDRAGDREKLIAITHNHGDHTGMLYAFENDENVNFLLPALDFAQDTIFPEGRKSLIDDLDTIDLGGDMTIQCVRVPGHTPGSIIYFLKGHNLAFSGDAIGSGGGVWIFSKDGFDQYVGGVQHLCEYVQDPANGIDTTKLVFWGGHFWQKRELEKLDIQYLNDMQTVVSQICEGTAESEPYSTSMKYLDTNFKYGIATVTWNAADAAAYVNPDADAEAEPAEAK